MIRARRRTASHVIAPAPLSEIEQVQPPIRTGAAAIVEVAAGLCVPDRVFLYRRVAGYPPPASLFVPDKRLSGKAANGSLSDIGKDTAETVIPGTGRKLSRRKV